MLAVGFLIGVWTFAICWFTVGAWVDVKVVIEELIEEPRSLAGLLCAKLFSIAASLKEAVHNVPPCTERRSVRMSSMEDPKP